MLSFHFCLKGDIPNYYRSEIREREEKRLLAFISYPSVLFKFYLKFLQEVIEGMKVLTIIVFE